MGPGSWLSPLIAAAERGDLEALEEALASDSPVDAMEAGWTALQRCLMAGHGDVALRLLDAGARASQTNPGHYTPLYRAALRNLCSVQQRLVELGADVNPQDLEDGKTPLMIAAIKAYPDSVTLLLQAGARLDRVNHAGMHALAFAQASLEGRRPESPSYAAAERTLAILTEACQQALSEQAVCVHPEATPEPEAALRLAAALGDEERVADWLTQDIRVDAPDPWNLSALTFAARYGHAGCARLLLEHDAKPSRVTRRLLLMDRLDLYDPLGWAILYNHADVVQVLAQKGVSVSRADKWGASPLMHAAHHGFQEVVQVLLDHGADRAHENRRGQNAAVVAELAGHADLAAMLRA